MPDQETRTVTVQDTLAPVITLSGSDSETVEAGFPYTDAGATAGDSLDGDVSGNVVVSGTADKSVCRRAVPKDGRGSGAP